MKFRIKKITYKSGDIVYYPQVKFRWWSCWVYFHYSYCDEYPYFMGDAAGFSDKERCVKYLNMKEKEFNRKKISKIEYE